jgi:hypothetical protein
MMKDDRPRIAQLAFTFRELALNFNLLSGHHFKMTVLL